AEHLADLLSALGHPPLGEVDLSVVGEQVEDAAPVLGHPRPVERLQVLHDQRLAVVDAHDELLSAVAGEGTGCGWATEPAWAARAARWARARIGPRVAPP